MLNPLKTKWYQVGEELGVPIDILNLIASEFRSDEERMEAMLRCWFERRNGDFTRSELEEAMQCVGGY